MKQAAMTSSSKPRPAFGVAVLRRAAKIRPASAGEHAHVDEGQEGQPLGLDARQLRRLGVAAQRVDAPADRGARGDEDVERDQHAP